MKIKQEELDDDHDDIQPGQIYCSWHAPGTVQAEPKENHIDIRPIVSDRIDSGKSFEDTRGTSEGRSFLDVFSQYIATSQETVMGEDNMYFIEERDVHLGKMKKEPDDVHSEAQVHDADQFSTVEGEQLEYFQGHDRNQEQKKRHENRFNPKAQETTPICKQEKDGSCDIRMVDTRQSSAGKEFEVQEKKRGRSATKRTVSGYKCLLEERNNRDSIGPESVQGEIEGSPMNNKTVGQTTSSTGVSDTLINSGTIPTNLNREINGPQNCLGKDMHNDSVCCNVLTENLSSNMMTQSKNTFVPSACAKEEKFLHSSECKEMFPHNTRSSKVTKTAVKSSHCTFCDLGFSSDSDLATHMTIHIREEPLKSAQCGQRVALKESLDIHVESLIGGSSYQCTSCNKGFSKYIGLSKHMKSHNVEKPHRCPQCGKYFALKNTLSVHLRTHNGERPYQCPVCNKTFSQCSSLKTHMHLHSGEKPHQCPHCGKRFALKNTLNVHLRTHSKERPYQCSVCSKRFCQRNSLSAHMSTHSGEKPYQCSQCGKQFTFKNTLTVHLRTHSGEKPYACCVCNRGFSQSSSVSVHMRTHTKEKPYQCPLCYKRFGYKNTLNAHFVNGHTLANT